MGAFSMGGFQAPGGGGGAASTAVSIEKGISQMSQKYGISAATALETMNRSYINDVTIEEAKASAARGELKVGGFRSAVAASLGEALNGVPGQKIINPETGVGTIAPSAPSFMLEIQEAFSRIPEGDAKSIVETRDLFQRKLLTIKANLDAEVTRLGLGGGADPIPRAELSAARAQIDNRIKTMEDLINSFDTSKQIQEFNDLSVSQGMETFNRVLDVAGMSLYATSDPKEKNARIGTIMTATRLMDQGLSETDLEGIVASNTVASEGARMLLDHGGDKISTLSYLLNTSYRNGRLSPEAPALAGQVVALDRENIAKEVLRPGPPPSGVEGSEKLTEALAKAAAIGTESYDNGVFDSSTAEAFTKNVDSQKGYAQAISKEVDRWVEELVNPTLVSGSSVSDPNVRIVVNIPEGEYFQRGASRRSRRGRRIKAKNTAAPVFTMERFGSQSPRGFSAPVWAQEDDMAEFNNALANFNSYLSKDVVTETVLEDFIKALEATGIQIIRPGVDPVEAPVEE